MVEGIDGAFTNMVFNSEVGPNPLTFKRYTIIF
jgi:hypothetical protein